MIVDFPPRPRTAMVVVDETEEVDKATSNGSEPSIPGGESSSLGGLSARMRLSALISDTRDLMSGMSVMSNDNQNVAKEEELLVSSSSSSLTSVTGSESSDDKNNNGDQTRVMMKQVQAKSDEIQRCLAGSDSTEPDVVDLWHLRTLSLSPGGLLNATLRKRCWPKLLGLDEAILLNNNTSNTIMSDGFSGSIRSLAVKTLAIQSALTQYEMPWDVESMIKSQRRAREAERMQSLLLRCAGNVNSSDAASVASSSVSSIAAPGTFHKQGKKEMTKQELSIMTNILTAVFRQTTSGLDAKNIDPAIIRQLADLAALLLINLESPSLTSLMMQSLAKEHHLHLNRTDDEIEKNRSTHTIDSVFWTLVDCRDDKLGSMLRGNMLAADTNDDDESSFVAGWITSWFASALPTGLDSRVSIDTAGTDSIASIELEVASRFIDVFLCSHPYMPIYVAVALVMHPVNRCQIEADNTPSSSSSLANLPSVMMASVLGIADEIFFDGNRNDGVGNTDNIAEDRRAELISVVEEIIAGGIDLMRTVPPSKVMETPTALPKYLLKDVAPTDFALIQQAKEARDGKITDDLSPISEASTPMASPNSIDGAVAKCTSSKFNFSDEVEKKTSSMVIPEKYSLAIIAAGMGQSVPNVQSVQSLRTWSACMAVYVLGVLVAISFDRFIVDVMSEVYDGIPTPLSSVVISPLKLRTDVQAFVSGASFIGSTIGPVFGSVSTHVTDIDLDDIIGGANTTHNTRMCALEDLIAGALPTTYYYY